MSTFSDVDIKLEEDIFLSGFTPTAAIIPKPKFDCISDESLQLKARLKTLAEFEIFYTEHNKRLENVETAHFVNEDLNLEIKQALDDLQSSKSSTAKDEDYNNDNDSNGDGDVIADDDDVKNNAENIVINGDALQIKKPNKSLKDGTNSKMENEQLSQLSKLKRELEAKSHVKKMYCNKLEVSIHTTTFFVEKNLRCQFRY